MAQETLFGKDPIQLTALVSELGLPAYAAGQMADWLYKKGIMRLTEMSNLSREARAKLEERVQLGITPPEKVSVSADGTKKYLFRTPGGQFVEAAYIPDRNRKTLCVSSQVGCKMGCLFCMTGKQGFQGNLDAAAILNQLRAIPERELVSNIVYMGMGEPMDNLDPVLESLRILTAPWGFGMSPRRITVSTIGVIPAMETFLKQSDCHLAISLHSPFDEERRKLMPIQTVYPVREVVQSLKRYDWSGQRRLSFEYILFGKLNDTAAHVRELARLLNGLRCRVNLIRFHPIPGTPLQRTDDESLRAFSEALEAKGIITTIRASRGQDIDAACGMLSTKALVKRVSES